MASHGQKKSRFYFFGFVTRVQSVSKYGTDWFGLVWTTSGDWRLESGSRADERCE